MRIIVIIMTIPMEPQNLVRLVLKRILARKRDDKEQVSPKRLVKIVNESMSQSVSGIGRVSVLSHKLHYRFVD